MAVLDLDEAWKEAFLTQQFEAQHHHYQHNYPGARLDLILDGEQPVGRLYVARWEKEIRIMDIALLPEHRNGGIGSFLLGELLHEASVVGKILSIHVERYNPALRLYQRLGFRIDEDKGVYLLLVAQPDDPQGQVKTAS
jgi:GNAT superfamily N-acetyltransferase